MLTTVEDMTVVLVTSDKEGDSVDDTDDAVVGGVGVTV